MKFYLAFLFIVAALPALAENDSFPRKSETIDPQFLLGVWESLDSLHHKIEFRFEGKEFFMAPHYGDSSALSFTHYHFLSVDSLSRVSNMGILIRWPPEYCYVTRKSENEIEIAYDSFGGKPILVNYGRIRKK